MSPMRARLLDLSHTVEHGLVTYPGLPAPVVSEHLGRAASRERYAEGTEFQIGRIEMVANTGTYLDSPFHRYADGKDLSQLALESLADLDTLAVRPDSGSNSANSMSRFARSASRSNIQKTSAKRSHG